MKVLPIDNNHTNKNFMSKKAEIMASDDFKYFMHQMDILTSQKLKKIELNSKSKDSIETAIDRIFEWRDIQINKKMKEMGFTEKESFLQKILHKFGLIKN